MRDGYGAAVPIFEGDAAPRVSKAGRRGERSEAAGVFGAVAGRNHEARDCGRLAQRRERLSCGNGHAVLSDAVGEERGGAGTFCPEHFQRHAPVEILGDGAGFGFGFRDFHQRPPADYVRAEERADEAGRGRRGAAVQAGSESAGADFSVQAVHGALCGGRRAGEILHEAGGRGFVVSAFRQGLGRRRGKPAESGWPEDGLFVEKSFPQRGAGERRRELRAGHRRNGRGYRQENGEADFPALSSVGRGQGAARGRAGEGRRRSLSDSAQRGKREVEFHCLAGASADRAGARRAEGRRFRDCGDGPRESGSADPEHDKAFHAGFEHGGVGRDLSEATGGSAERKADNRHDGS